MKKFISHFSLFLIIISILILLGLCLPATPREKKSLLFSKISKDSLLLNTTSPRIIFIGGSNLSFGLNSQMIKDSLGINPINTGIQASLGIIFMMDDVMPYLRKNDIVVLIPEYANFYGKFAYGSEELLRTVWDMYPIQKIKLRKEQWYNIAKYIPKYAFSKYNPMEYLKIKENSIYGIHSFNVFGDANAHWELKKQEFEPIRIIHGTINKTIFNEISNFNKQLALKDIQFYISFPCFQKTSFDYCRNQIIKIESELDMLGIKQLGNAERYCFADSLLFNKPYHLTKEGLDKRTQLLIEDLKDTMK